MLLWALAAAFGLSALVVASQVAYDAIRLAGAMVLVVLGVQSLVAARRGDLDPGALQGHGQGAAGGASRWGSFRVAW